MLKQRTLRNSIKAVGIGLHTGKNINLELIPAEINSISISKNILACGTSKDVVFW